MLLLLHTHTATTKDKKTHQKKPTKKQNHKKTIQPNKP